MADAQYVIDIAANMPDGAATSEQLDAVIEKLTGASKRSDEFRAAVARVTTELEAAKAVSAEAAAALAVGNEQYGLLEKTAVQAAKALEKVQSKGRFDPRAALAAHESQQALDAYTGTLKGLEDAAASASGKHDGLARTLKNITKIGDHADAKARAVNERYEKLGAVVARLPGPLSSVGGQILNTAKGANGLNLAFSGAEAAMIATAAASVAVVAAIVAVTVALVAGAVAFTKYAVEQADAARQADLSREAFAALSGAAAAGVAAFDDVAAATGLADGELRALTKQLKAAEVSASEMPAALRAAALAERALGNGGASEFIERVKAGETSVKAFAQEVEDKFGGIVAEQLRGIDAQLARGKKLWAGLFKGVDLDPFLDALTVLVGMLDKANPLAQAFGLAVEGAVNPIGPLALRAAYAIEAFALEFAIQLTKMYLVAKPAIRWLEDLFSSGDKAQESGGLLDVLGTLGRVAAVVGVVLGGVLAASLAALAFTIATLAGPLVLVSTLFYFALKATWDFVEGLVEVGAKIWTWATETGANLMLGLVEGIKGAVGAVVEAVSNAVGSAIDAAKEVLGIHSPSKVFAEIGTNTSEGFVQGVEAGTPEAQGSMAAMVGPDAASGSGASAGAARGPRGGASLAGATFNFYGVKDAEHARDMISEALTRLFEDDADSLGGAEVPV